MGYSWDCYQQSVIQADPEERLLVMAGPGNGKTAVACGRIAYLIAECGVEPVNVLLLSFTRTAVGELRDRIADHVGSEARASGVRIATIDSTCWTLLNGFDESSAKSFGGYEANVELLCSLIRRRNEDLLDHLSRYEHIIVDEAQDVLGVRAELIFQVLKSVQSTCGVTVFADPCQAIYGFADDDPAGSVRSASLLDLLQNAGLIKKELKELHRTAEASLISLLATIRPIVLDVERDPEGRYFQLREQIRGIVPQLSIRRDTIAADTKGRDDLLILYRTRAEAISTSSFLCSEGVPHRFRVAGLPNWIQPWVACIFSEYLQPLIDRPTFEARWRELGCSALPGIQLADIAWHQCLRVAGKGGRVSVADLRRVLARSRPPIEFCLPDQGSSGPTISTVHASKGREANEVYLYLPQEPEGEEVDWAEEARVLYVGATRAKARIRAAVGGATYSCYLEGTRRPFRPSWKQSAAQFEIGRDSDFDSCSVVSRSLQDENTAAAIQQRLRLAARTIQPCEAISDQAWDYKYRLFSGAAGAPEFPLGEFSGGFGRDVFQIAKRLEANSARKIPYIWQVGVRTAVLTVDSADCASLLGPYGRTGIFLAPVLRAWSKTFFRKRWN